MRKPKEMKIQDKEAVTLSDALLAYQMGYRTEVSNGKFRAFVKEEA